MLQMETALQPEEHKKMMGVLSRLRKDANAKFAFLIDRNGQQMAASGDTHSLDTTALSSLAAGNVAATDCLAKLLGEEEFSVLFHEGERDNLHISLVGQKGILVVIFDERSSLGLVRLRVKKAAKDLEKILVNLQSNGNLSPDSQGKGGDPFLGEITDEDIDNLFNL